MTTAANTTVYWTASNNSNYLNGYRQANSMRAAVRDARNYVRNELYGEGTITYYDNLRDAEQDCRLRTDERGMFTGHRWQTR